jgi:photosystem II stability/assembly factor-like uncharacterized protein
MRGCTGSSNGRLNLWLGLAVVLATSAGWTAVTLHRQAPTSPAPAISPTPLRAIQAEATGDAIGNLLMVSATTGWAQDIEDGAVLHTSSGVLRWRVASPATEQAVVAVAYVNAKAARALTVPGGARGSATLQSWATDDGGMRWSAEGRFSVRGLSPDLVGTLDFADPDHGWFSEIENGPGITGTALYRTADGGAHWTEIASVGPGGPSVATPSASSPSSCVEMTATFINPTTGWLTGSCAIGPPPLYVSHDGGLTWTEQPLTPIAGNLHGGSSFPPSFTSTEDGTLLTEDIGVQPVSTGLFVTSNDGRTWSLRYSSGGVPFGTAFVDADHGWLVLQSINGDAADPDLYATTDGGTAWSAVNAFPFSGVDLDFITAKRGWASTDLRQFSGGASYLLSTEDGGRSWTGLRPVISTSPRKH